MTKSYLFVYGTLKQKYNHEMHKVLLKYGHYISPATYVGKLYQVKHYPGMIKSYDNEIVYGEIYEIFNIDELFTILDEYEECSISHPEPHEYKRVIDIVTLESKETIKSYMYLYNHAVENLTQIKSGNF